MLKSYPMLLRNNGYYAGLVGKYGVACEAKPRDVFDAMKGIGRAHYFKKQPDGSERHETELWGDWAVEFLNKRPKNKPFCLSISFNASHAEDGDKRPGIGHFPWLRAMDGMYEDIETPAPRLSDPAIFENQPEFLRTSMNRVRYG
jgi:choline-sulfatase